LASVTDPKNQIVQYTNDLDDKVTAKEYYNVQQPTADVYYDYDDPLGRLTSMEDEMGTSTYEYYPIGSTGGGKLKTVKQPVGSTLATVGYTYDDDGRVVNRSIDGVAETYGYDGTGQLNQVTNSLGTFAYVYDADTANLKEVQYPNGQKADYSYLTSAQSGRLAEISNNTGGQVLSKFDYQYTANGSVTQWIKQLGDTATPVTMAMTYDRTDQLTGFSQGSEGAMYVYDAAGNRTREEKTNQFVNTFDVNNLNQLTDITRNPIPVKGYTNRQAAVTINGNHVSDDGSQGFETTIPVVSGLTTPLTITAVATDGTVKVDRRKVKNTVAYQYDANGNLINDGEKSYTWDAADRLIRVNVLNNVPTTVADTVEFKYNGLGQRVGIAEKHGDTVLNEKSLLWVGDWVREERDSSGLTTKNRFFDRGESKIASGVVTNYYYSLDHLKSVREMTDVNSVVQVKYDYDLWGRQIKLSGDKDATFGYTRFYVCRSVGLDLTWYRAFSTEMGRWLSRDPLDFGPFGGKDSYDPYVFVKNDPTRYIDPLGLKECDCTKESNDSPPLPSNSPECDKYGDTTYMGTSLKCFCKCAGDSPWSQQVRGCLRCEHYQGSSTFAAHMKCYSGAGANAPVVTLGSCYVQCLSFF
jgi:RHS repeat-associated protein